jgi:hypothetical protein
MGKDSKIEGPRRYWYAKHVCLTHTPTKNKKNSSFPSYKTDNPRWLNHYPNTCTTKLADKALMDRQSSTMTPQCNKLNKTSLYLQIIRNLVLLRRCWRIWQYNVHVINALGNHWRLYGHRVLLLLCHDNEIRPVSGRVILSFVFWSKLISSIHAKWCNFYWM